MPRAASRHNRNTLYSAGTLNKRYALFFYSSIVDSRQKKTTTDILEQIHQEREEIKTELERCLEVLEALTDHSFPPIDLRVECRASSRPVTDVIRVKQEYGLHVRAVMDARPAADSREQKAAKISPSIEQVSHLIELVLSSKSGGWFSSSEPYTARVLLPAEKVFSFLVDLGLDIASFHSWPFLKHEYVSSAARLAFSKKKVQFILNACGPNTYYGPVEDVTVGYVSLASCVRKSNELRDSDLQQYEALWEQFVAHEIVPSLPHITEKSAAQTLLKSLKMQGEISPKKLQKAYASLDPGRYVFVVTDKKPDTNYERDRILALLGYPPRGKSKNRPWKRRAWRFVSYEECGPHLRHWPHLLFLSFTKKEQKDGKYSDNM